MTVPRLADSHARPDNSAAMCRVCRADVQHEELSHGPLCVYVSAAELLPLRRAAPSTQAAARFLPRIESAYSVSLRDRHEPVLEDLRGYHIRRRPRNGRLPVSRLPCIAPLALGQGSVRQHSRRNCELLVLKGCDSADQQCQIRVSEGLLTTEPCNATIFLVPVFTADYLQVGGLICSLLYLSILYILLP